MDTLRLIAFGRPPGFLAAIHNGYFRAEQLEVDFTQTRGSVQQIRGLLAGDWEIAHTAVDNVLAYVDAENADLVIFLVGDLGNSQLLVVGPAITSFEGLRGKTIGLDALTTGYAFMLYRILALNGLGRAEYRTVAVGGTAERLEALLAGQIDLALLGPPHDEAALSRGCRVLAGAAAYFPDYPGLTAATRRSWAETHRALVVRYCRALLAGIRWAADPQRRNAMIAILGTALGSDSAAAERLYEAESGDRKKVIASVREMRHAIQTVAALRREMTDGVPERLPGTGLDRYFDPSYAIEADPRLAGS